MSGVSAFCFSRYARSLFEAVLNFVYVGIAAGFVRGALSSVSLRCSQVALDMPHGVAGFLSGIAAFNVPPARVDVFEKF
ncbi:MAG: hypothetical protein DBX55_07860 [Verrucomicrobia bacterium]|nr:MAG: hypothetical protein DBX55_08545 [Verrucomicrobiota bacterium]PWM28982.1 MAG: hypothetical protein DBX55_07860 [Verrucomicrobiota bacterium]